MQMWKNWALQLCTVLIASGIITLLLPNGGGKAGKTAVSLFILCSIVLPFRKMNESFVLDFSQPELAAQYWESQLQPETDNLAYSMAEAHILELIQSQLELMEIEVYGVEVELIETDSTADLIIQMRLPTTEQFRESELRNMLRQEYGITQADIIWQGDD